MTGILGLPPARTFLHFLVVDLANKVSVDFYQKEGAVAPQHYAFLVERRRVRRRLRADRGARACPIGPIRRGPSPARSTRHYGGRGLYFEDPDGHLLEIITTALWRRTARLSLARQQHPRLGRDLGEHRRGGDRGGAGALDGAAELLDARRPARPPICRPPPWDRRPCAARGIRAGAARNRGRGRRSAAAPTGRAPGNGWPRSAPSRARAPRRAWCRRGSAATSSIAELLAEHGEADRAVQLEQADDPVGDRRSARPARRARRAGCRPRPRASGRSRSSTIAFELGEARARAARPARPASCPARCTRSRSAMCSWSAGRGLVEQREAHLLGHVGRRRARPRARPCRTAARRRGRRRRPGRTTAPSSSVSAKGATMPSRLTKRLATLVAMISLAQPVARGSRRACRSCIALREGGAAARGSSVGSSVELAASIAACSAHLGGRQQDRELGPGQAAILLARGAAAPRCCRAPRPRGRAGRSPRASRSTRTQLRQRRARRRARRSTAPASAADCPRARARRPRRSSRRAARCASSSSSRPSAISRLSGILMLTSLSEQSTPARIVDEVGVDPPAVLGELDARRPG